MKNNKKRLGIIAVVVVFVAAAAGVYFFVLHPSNSDRDKALTNVKVLRDNYQAITDIVNKDTVASAFSSANVETIQTAALNYQQAIESLDSSPAITNNSAAVSVWESETAMRDFGKTALNFTVSLQYYRQIIDTCNTVITNANSYKTPADLDAANTDCAAILSASESSPSALLNSNLLTAYRSDMNALLDAMRQYISAQSTANKVAVTNAATSLGNLAKQKADYTLSPNPTDAINKLASALGK